MAKTQTNPAHDPLYLWDQNSDGLWCPSCGEMVAASRAGLRITSVAKSSQVTEKTASDAPFHLNAGEADAWACGYNAALAAQQVETLTAEQWVDKLREGTEFAETPFSRSELMTRDGETKTVETQTVAGRHLADLILEYARDLRRNSSGGDNYPWEYAKGTADYLEELVRRVHIIALAQGARDPFNRKQVEAVCRAVCKVEGLDPDGDTFGDGCDPAWTRYADAVANHLPAPAQQPANLPFGWEYQAQTNSVVCGGCAFRYGAEHSDSDGSWTCPNCGNGNGAAQPPAAPVETEDAIELVSQIIYQEASISHYGDESEVDNSDYVAREVLRALARKHHSPCSAETGEATTGPASSGTSTPVQPPRE